VGIEAYAPTDNVSELTARTNDEGGEAVFHLTANADVRFGTEHPRKDLEQNTIATFNVVEAVRVNGAARRVFLDGFGLRRTGRVPDAGSRKASFRLTRKGSGFAAISSALSPSWVNAIATVTSTISTINCASIPATCTFSATDANGSRICMWAIAFPRS
jgi:hypothetical protein